MNQSHRLLTFCLAIAMLVSMAWAITQSIRLQAVQQKLTELQGMQSASDRQMDQCESNMRSAAIQLGNLSNIVQEATAAAAECLQADTF
jgi:uncharacterized membrane protein YjgN (DUF898 family)